MATSRQVDLTFDLAYPTEHYKFLQRLGERRSTDIVVQIYNKGIPYNISGTILGFEMRNDRNKVVIDKEQSRFTKVTPLQGVFSYKPPEEVQSFYGNAYLAYFTLENGADRVTTERFRFYNDEDVQACIAPDLQEHYVSVIDDLVASNASAMDKANEIKDLIEANQVVKKTGDTMTGDLRIEQGKILRFLNVGNTITAASIGVDANNRLYGWSDAANTGIFTYDPTTKVFNLQADTNLMKKTGDTFTGTVRYAHAFSQILQSDSGKRAWVVHHPDSDSILFAPETAPNSGAWDWAKGIEFKGDGTIRTAKNGRANLTLNAGFVIHDANYGAIADRRGNTVTLRMAIRREVSSTSDVALVLPVDMRPTLNLPQNLVTNEGKAVRFVVESNGNVKVGSVGDALYVTTTYVVD
ncbi:BppU family phage baseplate upper protein [Bacillus cereus]|uniref:BppU family phage baseplate upper protein n=1 Tax=Bacillus cereus TaxID=1396 RepID=UPI0013D3C502|nr:BppU family phage baseplate upper protein [Bacillus cereus]